MKYASAYHLGGYGAGGDPESWYPNLWSWVCHELEVRSVLDVGCGEGQASACFEELGCDVVGIDGSLEALAHSVILKSHVLHDFTKGPWETDRTFDLVWSCEFVEHVDAQYERHFLRAFMRAERYVFMTHARPGEEGHHHVNCQRAGYWVRKLRDCGFDLDYRLTRRARGKAGRGYFLQSGLVFVKSPRPSMVPVGPALALLSVETAVRRLWNYIRKHGTMATFKRALYSR